MTSSKIKNIFSSGEVIAWGFLIIFPILMLSNILWTPIHIHSDDYFHLSRIYNLYQSRFDFLYPQNFASLGRVGSIVNVFYPPVLLQMITAILPKGLGAITVLKIVVCFVLYLNTIAVYVLLRYKLAKSRSFSLAMAIFWGAVVISFDIASTGGEAIGKLSFPFIAYGLINLRKKNAYIYLVLGFSFALYTHLLTTLFLVVFVLIYSLFVLFNQKEWVSVVLTGVKTIALTALTGMIVYLPVIYFGHYNEIAFPPQPASFFTGYNRIYLSSIIENPMYLVMIAFVIISIFITKKISLGTSLSLIIALLGTAASSWPFFLQHTSVNVIQFPYRLFQWGLYMAIMFSIFSLANISKQFKNQKTILICSVIFSIFLGSGIYQYWFPKVNEDGTLWVATTKDVETSIDKNEDGYHLYDFPSFTDSMLDDSASWNLMNFSDYAPRHVLKDTQSKFLKYDDRAKHVAMHELKTSTNHYVETKNFTSSYNMISFSPSSDVHATKIALPVFGYNKTKLNVFINGKLVSYNIENGLVTVSGSLKSSDVIVIKQMVPLVEKMAFVFSALGWIIFISFVFKIRKNKRYKRESEGIEGKVN
ncbi:hypothetical protein [Fructobacillus durionis]|uniref:Membrane protein YfhO n=1 Tax=Fructobacillus durionis TaxID=283737 RepID=A0A1I1E426_9LACO|nr:hypothetical protein [Fructobacillus durionis]SFB81416.1 hypothetical protein SAMN05660453_0263 [Fructobacillus durionis]